jgi:hypothetical protein
MSKALGMRCVWGLCGVLVSCLALASVARAEVSTDVSGSMLVFPKVVWTGFDGDETTPARDTVIQISNTSNNLVHAHCFYVNGAEFNGRVLWQVTDFQIWLTRQQPTHWVASQGRSVNPSDNFPGGQDGSGLDPGAVPPVPEGFTGELKCIQVDASGIPFGGNNLKGEAVIREDEGDVSKHNAIAILANPDLAAADPATELLLNNTPIEDGEYNACPNQLLVDHLVDGTITSTNGGTDPRNIVETFNPLWCADGECPIRTTVTLVPCSQDFENQIPGEVKVQFQIINELEQIFSASTTVNCWADFRLADVDAPTGRCSVSNAVCQNDDQCIDAAGGFCNKNSVFSTAVLGTGSALTIISPVDLAGGVIGVGEETVFNNLRVDTVQISNRATAAWNLHQVGNRFDATRDLPGGPVIDRVTVPTGF